MSARQTGGSIRAMTDPAAPRLHMSEAPSRADPQERVRYLQDLVRQEWRDGLTHAELVDVLTDWQRISVIFRGQMQEDFRNSLIRNWQTALPVLTLPAVLAEIERGPYQE